MPLQPDFYNMSLADKRRKFSEMLPLLIGYAHYLGYTVSIDFVKRCEDCEVGHPRSLHKSGLAVDLNLYLNGEYLTNTTDHTPLGEFWEFLGGSWGGRFDDGNHYSIPHGGMR